MTVDVQTKSGRFIPGPPVNPRSASAVLSWLYEAAQAEANAIGRQHLDHPWLSQINVKNPTPDNFDTLNEYTFGTAAPVFDAGTGALINGRVAKVNPYSFKGAERYGYGGYYGEAKQETRGKLSEENPIRRFEVFLAETALTQPLAIKYGYTEGAKRGVAWYVDLPQEEIVAYLLGCAFQTALAGRSPESISGVLALQVIENTRAEFAAFTLPLTKWEEARNSALLRFNPVYGKRLYRIFGLSVGDGETAPDVATMERGEDAPPYVGVVRIMAPQTQPVWMPVVAQRFPFAVTYAVDTERYGVTHIPTGLGTPIDVPGAVKGRVRSILTALGFLDLLIEYLGDKFGVTASFGDGSTIPAEEMRAAADVLRDRVYPMLASETGLAEVRALAAEAYPELAAFEREVAVEPVEGGGERAKPIRFKALTPGSSPAARALRSVTERAEWPDPLPADVAEYVEVAVDALVHKHFRGDRARAHASVIRFFSAIVDKDKERVRSFTNALEGKVFEKIFKALTGTHTNALVDSDPHRLDAEHERQKLHDARVEQERDATARKAAAAVTVEGVPGDVFVRERLPQALALLDGQWVNEPPLRALFAGGGPPQLNVDAPGKPFTSPRTVRLVEIPHPVRDDIYREIKAGRLTMPIVRVHTVYTRDFPQPGLIDAKYGEALRLVSGTVEIEPLSGPTFVFSHREVKPEVRRKLVAFDKSYDASDVRVAYVLEPKQWEGGRWADLPVPAAVVAASAPHVHPGGMNVEVAGQISRLVARIRTLQDEVKRTVQFNRKVELNSEINKLTKELIALRARVYEPAAPERPASAPRGRRHTDVSTLEEGTWVQLTPEYRKRVRAAHAALHTQTRPLAADYAIQDVPVARVFPDEPIGILLKSGKVRGEDRWTILYERPDGKREEVGRQPKDGGLVGWDADEIVTLGRIEPEDLRAQTIDQESYVRAKHAMQAATYGANLVRTPEPSAPPAPSEFVHPTWPEVVGGADTPVAKKLAAAIDAEAPNDWRTSLPRSRVVRGAIAKALGVGATASDADMDMVDDVFEAVLHDPFTFPGSHSEDPEAPLWHAAESAFWRAMAKEKRPAEALLKSGLKPDVFVALMDGTRRRQDAENPNATPHVGNYLPSDHPSWPKVTRWIAQHFVNRAAEGPLYEPDPVFDAQRATRKRAAQGTPAADDDDTGAGGAGAAIDLAADPIAAAVMPLKADAIVSAKQAMEKRIAWMRAKLEAAEWDLDKVAPSPDGRMGRPEYMAAQGLRASFSAVTSRPPRDRNVYDIARRGDPYTVQMDETKIAQVLRMTGEEAASAYDAFVEKLRQKIGPCTAATLEGSHVWGDSILTVTKPDGAVERWQTHQIVNVSSLGKLFNQWPTRKLGPRKGQAATASAVAAPADRLGPPVWTVGKHGPGTLGHHENNPNFGYTLEPVAGWGEDAADEWVAHARDMRPEEPVWYTLEAEPDAWVPAGPAVAPKRFLTVAAAHAYIAAHPAPPHMTDEAPPPQSPPRSMRKRSPEDVVDATIAAWPDDFFGYEADVYKALQASEVAEDTREYPSALAQYVQEAIRRRNSVWFAKRRPLTQAEAEGMALQALGEDEHPAQVSRFAAAVRAYSETGVMPPLPRGREDGKPSLWMIADRWAKDLDMRKEKPPGLSFSYLHMWLPGSFRKGDESLPLVFLPPDVLERRRRARDQSTEKRRAVIQATEAEEGAFLTTLEEHTGFETSWASASRNGYYVAYKFRSDGKYRVGRVTSDPKQGWFRVEDPRGTVRVQVPGTLYRKFFKPAQFFEVAHQHADAARRWGFVIDPIDPEE